MGFLPAKLLFLLGLPTDIASVNRKNSRELWYFRNSVSFLQE